MKSDNEDYENDGVLNNDTDHDKNDNESDTVSAEFSAISADLLDGNAFEEIMKERTRIRREKEEYHIGELRVKMNKLEQALIGETKRRIDSINKIERNVKSEVENLQSNLLDQMKEEHKVVMDQYSKLENNIKELEKHWKNDCHQQSKDITNKSDQLQQLLQDLRVQTETERKSRLIREGKLLQSIEQHGKVIQEQFDREREIRDQSILELKTTIDQQESIRHQQQQSFEQRLYDELQSLQRELNVETQERKLQDKAIVQALNRYTQQFQQSLSILTEN